MKCICGLRKTIVTNHMISLYLYLSILLSLYLSISVIVHCVFVPLRLYVLQSKAPLLFIHKVETKRKCILCNYLRGIAYWRLPLLWPASSPELVFHDQGHGFRCLRSHRTYPQSRRSSLVYPSISFEFYDVDVCNRHSL